MAASFYIAFTTETLESFFTELSSINIVFFSAKHLKQAAVL